MLLSWSVRFLIGGGGGGGVLDRHYGLRAKEIADGEVKTSVEIAKRMKGIIRTDAEFLEAFQTHRVSKERLARYYLRSLELAKAGEPNADLGGILEDPTRYNLEHIIPLTPRDEWKLADEVVRAYSKRLGNMTLLDPSSNEDIGNKSFAEKKPIYAKSPLLITQEIAENDSWGAPEIDSRQTDLAKIALKVWGH